MGKYQIPLCTSVCKAIRQTLNPNRHPFLKATSLLTLPITLSRNSPSRVGCYRTRGVLKDKSNNGSQTIKTRQVIISQPFHIKPHQPSFVLFVRHPVSEPSAVCSNNEGDNVGATNSTDSSCQIERNAHYHAHDAHERGLTPISNQVTLSCAQNKGPLSRRVMPCPLPQIPCLFNTTSHQVYQT